jgi:hypothetical protein
MKWLLLICIVGYSVASFGCSRRAEDEGDTDSETVTTQPVPTDTGGISDFATESGSTSESAEDTSVHIDTADGVGGVDEECYTFNMDDTLLMWCDTPEMVMQQCDTFASGCCCRSSCDPAMCETVDETMPCTVYDTQNLLGYCDYVEDNIPIAYDCEDTCVPQSLCDTSDSDGTCLDSDAEKSGVCLMAGEDLDIQIFCQPACEIALCDDTHYCSPVFNGAVYDGTGACLPE